MLNNCSRSQNLHCPKKYSESPHKNRAFLAVGEEKRYKVWVVYGPDIKVRKHIIINKSRCICFSQTWSWSWDLDYFWDSVNIVPESWLFVQVPSWVQTIEEIWRVDTCKVHLYRTEESQAVTTLTYPLWIFKGTSSWEFFVHWDCRLIDSGLVSVWKQFSWALSL